MISRGRLLLICALLLIVALLGYVNWMLAVNPIDTSPVVAQSDVPQETQDLPASTAHIAPLGPLSDRPETTARPLFSPSRRPNLPPPQERAAAPPQPPKDGEIDAPGTINLKLVGLMQMGNNRHRALIRSVNEPEGVWLDIGSEIGGWRLAKVSEERVIVEGAGGRYALSLYRDPAATNTGD